MKKIYIEGMSCEHCVAHVTEALEEMDCINIEVNLKDGYALAGTEKSDEEIINAIDEAGYDAIRIEEIND